MRISLTSLVSALVADEVPFAISEIKIREVPRNMTTRIAIESPPTEQSLVTDKVSEAEVQETVVAETVALGAVGLHVDSVMLVGVAAAVAGAAVSKLVQPSATLVEITAALRGDFM